MRLGVSTFSLTNEWLSPPYARSLLGARGRARARPRPRGDRASDSAAIQTSTARTSSASAGSASGSGSSLRPSAATSSLLRRPGGAMTLEECVEALEAQIDAASGLGVGVIRLTSASPSRRSSRPFLRRSAPASSLRPSSRAANARRAVAPGVARPPAARRVSIVALVLDFSIAMRAMPTTFADAVCSAGMARGDLDRIFELWRNGGPVRGTLRCDPRKQAPRPRPRRGALGVRAFRPTGSPPGRRSCHWLRTRTRSSGRSTRRVTIRRPRCSRRHAARRKFSGVVTSEWGGSAWVDGDDVDGFAIVAQHSGS